MNNFEKIQKMDLNELAWQLSALVIDSMYVIANKIYATIETTPPELTEEDVKMIYNTYVEYLKKENA